MTDFSSTPLNDILTSVTRRLRWQEMSHLTLVALGGGLTVTLMVLFAGRLYPLGWPVVLLSIGLGLTGIAILGSWLYAWLRPRPPHLTAQLIDRQFQLDERLATAWELDRQRDTVPGEIIQAQMQDTLDHLVTFKANEQFPMAWPWPRLLIVSLLAVAIFLGLWLPNPQVAILQQQAQNEQLIAEQTAELVEIKEALLEEETLVDTPEGEELIETLDDLIEKLQQQNLTPQEAMAAMSEAEESLAELQEATEQATGLNEVAESLNDFNSTQDLAEALENQNMTQAEEMLESMAQEALANPPAAAEMAQALRQAAQTARQAGNEELAQALEQAAQALEQAAQNGDAQALEQAGDALAEAGQLGNQEALEQALGNIQQAKEQLAQQGAGATAGRGNLQSIPGEGRGGGAGREDPGSGADGLTAEQGAPDFMETDNGPNQGQTGEYESLAVPQHLGGEGGPIVKPEEQGATGGLPIGEAPINPEQEPGASVVPYNEVYGEYNEAAGEALENSYIPLGMKGYVREYFGSLEPTGNEAGN